MVVNNSTPITIDQGHTDHIMLMSDLHLLSSNCNTKAIKADLELARANNARILINGDVFDFILPGDAKRFALSATRDVGMRNDLINAAVDEAVKLLQPYGDLLDVVGMGNHETHVEKKHSVDAISLLVGRLRAEGSSVEHGDICGWYRRRYLYSKSKTKSWTLRLFRHHGVGASSPTTKGIGDFSRMLTYVDGSVDIMWLGHKHNRFVDTMERHGMKMNGTPYVRSTLCVMTGSYLNLHPQQTSSDILSRGRKSNYASEVNMAPQTKGGILIGVRPNDDGSLSLSAHLNI